jgi:hypothetical protein
MVPVPAQMWEGKPSPSADVEGASPVPAQMWEGRAHLGCSDQPEEVMLVGVSPRHGARQKLEQLQTQSTPGADVAGGEPQSQRKMRERGQPRPGANAAGVSPVLVRM